MLKNKFNFESEFTDADEDVVCHIYCKDSQGVSYGILIDVQEDPYDVFFSDGRCPENMSEFREELFAYLTKKYPDCF